MHETMRHRMERFVILPFSVGCVSQSSVAVSDNQPKMTHAEHNPSPKGLSTGSGGGEDRQSFVGGKAGKPHPLGVLALPRPGNISAGLQRLIKSFRGLSQLFTLHRGEEDDGEEMEMQIGFPTDVKHVAHIGWDGSSVGGGPIMKSWDRGPDLLALPSISLRQFEAAMAAPAAGPLPLGARCLSRSRFIINN